MKDKFDIRNLPNDVQKRIEKIDFAKELVGEYKGMVWIKDEFRFRDGGHHDGFSNKAELIKIVRAAYKANEWNGGK